MTLIVWMAVAMLLVAAVMLVTDIGAPALWIGVTTAGVAIVVVDRTRGRHSLEN